MGSKQLEKLQLGSPSLPILSWTLSDKQSRLGCLPMEMRKGWLQEWQVKLGEVPGDY
jgi:hypothetical protein